MNTAEHIVLAKPEVWCSSGSPGGGSYGVFSSSGFARAISASFDGSGVGAGTLGADEAAGWAAVLAGSGEVHATARIAETATMSARTAVGVNNGTCRFGRIIWAPILPLMPSGINAYRCGRGVSLV